MLFSLGITINGEAFTGLNFRGFRSLSEKRESFPYESFAINISIYWSLPLYHESITIYYGYCESFPIYGIMQAYEA